MIVAVSVATFDGYPGAGANPNLNPICNQGIEITCASLTCPAAMRALTRPQTTGSRSSRRSRTAASAARARAST
jgi:hypothetical protein